MNIINIVDKVTEILQQIVKHKEEKRRRDVLWDCAGGKYRTLSSLLEILTICMTVFYVYKEHSTVIIKFGIRPEYIAGFFAYGCFILIMAYLSSKLYLYPLIYLPKTIILATADIMMGVSFISGYASYTGFIIAVCTMVIIFGTIKHFVNYIECVKEYSKRESEKSQELDTGFFDAKGNPVIQGAHYEYKGRLYTIMLDSREEQAKNPAFYRYVMYPGNKKEEEISGNSFDYQENNPMMSEIVYLWKINTKELIPLVYYNGKYCEEGALKI